MSGSIIWYICVLGCAALFFGIGMYAQRSQRPMHFWAGVEVKASEISDVRAYNLESARMWKRYSIWFWLAGFAWAWSPTAALILLLPGGALGTVLLVRTYLKIEKKYKAQ